MSIIRINKFHAKVMLADDLHAFLVSIVPIIKQSEGCTSCQLLRGKDDTNEFVLIEKWTSVADHKASVKAIPPEKFDLVLPMLSSPPTGSYYVE